MSRSTHLPTFCAAVLILVGSQTGSPAAGVAAVDDVVYANLSLGNGVVVYRAVPGLANDSYVNWGNGGATGMPPTFMGDDYWGHQVVIDPACGENPWITGYPSCANGGDKPVVEVYLGDGNDIGHSGNTLGVGRLVRQYGEEGDDGLSGDVSIDYLYGGPGNDIMAPDGLGRYSAAVFSPGDVVSGGDGIDTVQVKGYSAVGIRVTLDGVADDGELAADGVTSRDGDSYLADVENVIGATNTSNQVVGSDLANSIKIENDSGDRVDGRGGADTIWTGGGADTIMARDGVADTIDCGEDVDAVVADEIDVLTGCENIDLPDPSGARPASKRVAASANRRTAALRLACGAGETRCTGRVTLRATKGAQGVRKGTVLARGRYDLAAGQRGRVKLRLTKAARRALGARSKVPATLVLRPSAGQGGTTRVRLTR